LFITNRDGEIVIIVMIINKIIPYFLT